MDVDLLAALEGVIGALDELGIRYMVGGSVASSAMGEARMTFDVDLVADLPASRIDALASRLGDGYYHDVDAIRDAVGRRGSFNLIHLATVLKIDVFILKDTPYDREAFGRMAPTSVGPSGDQRTFQVCSPEDIILHKLHWFELGERVSERQWRDVMGVLRVRGRDLDVGYMERWARELGLSELLDQAVAEVGSPKGA